jgi:protein TonB
LFALSVLNSFSVKSIPQSNTAQNIQKVSDTPCIPKTDTLDGQKVYRKVEKAAEFLGGQAEFSRFIWRNLRYREQEDNQDLASLTMVIDTFGNIRNLCVLNNPDPNILSSFDSSVVEIFHKMPKWVPAELNGKKVYSRHFPTIRVCLQ